MIVFLLFDIIGHDQASSPKLWHLGERTTISLIGRATPLCVTALEKFVRSLISVLAFKEGALPYGKEFTMMQKNWIIFGPFRACGVRMGCAKGVSSVGVGVFVSQRRAVDLFRVFFSISFSGFKDGVIKAHLGYFRYPGSGAACPVSECDRSWASGRNWATGHF